MEMVNKTTGYVISLVGFFILALSVKPIKEFFIVYFSFLENINNMYLMIAGLVILVLGILVLRGNSRKISGGREIPIYHGKNIIGYRRH